MAGTALSSLDAADGENGSGGGGNSSNALYLNSFRISAAAGRLAMHVCPQEINDVVEFCQLCLSLARGIDCAITSNDVPTKALELPSLFKQVCRRKGDPFMQAAIMVLMISVKSACRSGWFSDKDSEDLFHLANEISSSFCSSTNFKCEPSSSLAIISMVMSRFFPLLQMGQIFAFLEVKPGYGTFIIDFHLSKNVKTSPEDKIRLLVAQIDNTETSSCLINPPLANFLLNGKGVEKRTNAAIDTGPQIPTVVSHMLKYGTNLLQAVGEFNGNYIVVLAFMSIMPAPDPATLLDYVRPTPASVDPDSEIIEGPSRISLNCPISFRRIKTPVKGLSCKHIQCFDYQNYIDINSRRPSWRCPRCNQNACFTDLRIDQDMAKVLKEVGENITDVIFSSDGSWKAIMESDGHTDNPTLNFPDVSKDETVLPDSSGISSFSGDILDLTELDDPMDVVATRETEDHKGFQTNFQNQQPFAPNNPSEANHTSHTDDDFWSGVYLSTFESGRVPSIARHALGRTPVAVQALPVQPPPLVPQQRTEDSSTLNSSSPTSQAAPVIPNASPSNIERQHSFSRFGGHTNPVRPAPTPFRAPSTGFGVESLNANRQGIMNQHTPYMTHQSQGLSRSPVAASFPRNNIQGSSQIGVGHVRGLQPMLTPQRPAQILRPVQLSPLSRNADPPRVALTGDQRGNPVDLTADQNWRPTGRMRGSLSGRAFSEALEHYVIRPTQQAQALRPSSIPPNISPQLQAIIANRFGHASPPSSTPAATPDASAVLPQHSSGMQ